MKVISFLGVPQASETTYYLPDSREHTAWCSSAAPVPCCPVDTLLVFVTAGARTKHYDRLAEGFVPSVLPIPIPVGRDEIEPGKIFSKLADMMQPNGGAIFDITYGFRSLPFHSFLAATYLDAAKRVTLNNSTEFVGD